MGLKYLNKVRAEYFLSVGNTVTVVAKYTLSWIIAESHPFLWNTQTVTIKTSSSIYISISTYRKLFNLIEDTEQ